MALVHFEHGWGSQVSWHFYCRWPDSGSPRSLANRIWDDDWLLLSHCRGTLGFVSGTATCMEFWHPKTKVETDSLCITQLLAKPLVTSNEYAPLIQAIKDYLNLDWQVSLSHIYREANFAADYMANLAFSIPLGLIVYPTPPLGVRSFLFHDSYGISYPRSVVL